MIQRVLKILFVIFLSLGVRIWYLTMVKHDEYRELASRPKQKVVIDVPNRGTIRDRFNIPLAVNVIQYNATLRFDPIRMIPRTRWEKGKKTFPRKEYITRLSTFLSEKLDLEATAIEDLLHSKASLFPNTPFVIKEKLSEEEYYRLHIQERDWPGLFMQIASRRHYPKGFVASSVLGFLGPISDREFLSVQKELSLLEEFLRDRAIGLPTVLPKGFSSARDVKERYFELKNKSYTLQSKVGKAGIEAQFDEELRGLSGKKKYEVDIHGNIRHELPESYAATPGRRFILSISSELQEFAETLLIESEISRHDRFGMIKDNDKVFSPWIKGGAIVAMIPSTGEVVALASYPRFNPNEMSIKWLETPSYIGQIWDGLKPLEREFGPLKKPEERYLDLNLYLDIILSKDSEPRKTLDAIPDLESAVRWLKRTETEDDKLLVLDILQLIVPDHLFTEGLLHAVGKLPLATYRAFNQEVMRAEAKLRSVMREAFHKNQFALWRKEHFASYLKEKRAQEKTYERPYLDYLTEKEEELFQTYFHEHKAPFLAELLLHEESTLSTYLRSLPEEAVIPFLRTMRSFQELDRPLLGRYYFPAKAGRAATEQDLARHFYPFPGFGYARSHAFQENCSIGSIFKLVTGYEGVRQHYLRHKELNPLTLTDQSPSYTTKMTKQTILGYTDKGKPITRFYKGGRLPRSHLNIGKIDLRSALERTSNLYFCLLASDVLEDPSDLSHTAKMLGFGKKTGIDLPGEIKGSVPTDISDNPTNLYAFAIGQHTLTVSPLQTSVCLSAFANHGHVLKPQIVKTIANLEPTTDPNFTKFLYRDYFTAVGLNFPLFTEAQEKEIQPLIKSTPSEVVQEIYLPEEIRTFLLGGLLDVVNGARGTARPATIRTLHEKPILKREYEEMRPTFGGKTSTAEAFYRPFLNRSRKPVICNHAWFGAIGFSNTETLDADLVVIVYLRYADYGKEAALIASRLLKKWRTLNNP